MPKLPAQIEQEYARVADTPEDREFGAMGQGSGRRVGKGRPPGSVPLSMELALEGAQGEKQRANARKRITEYLNRAAQAGPECPIERKDRTGEEAASELERVGLDGNFWMSSDRSPLKPYGSRFKKPESRVALTDLTVKRLRGLSVQQLEAWLDENIGRFTTKQGEIKQGHDSATGYHVLLASNGVMTFFRTSGN